MAYNYSPEYLGRNQTMAQKLLKIAQSGEVLKAQFESWHEMNAQRAYVSGLLANIAHNMPEFKDIRKSIRTWTAMEGELYTLYVGRPSPGHVLSGRKPGEPPKADWRQAYLQNDLVAVSGGTAFYEFPDSIDSVDVAVRMVGKFQNLPASVRTGRFHVVDLDEGEGADYFRSAMEAVGWHIAKIANGYIYVER